MHSPKLRVIKLEIISRTVAVLPDENLKNPEINVQKSPDLLKNP